MTTTPCQCFEQSGALCPQCRDAISPAPSITPGPWTVNASTGFPLILAGEKRIAQLSTAYDDANARAIAAVPELIAVLRKLEDWGTLDTAQGLDGETNYAGLDAIQAEAHAALRKAGAL